MKDPGKNNWFYQKFNGKYDFLFHTQGSYTLCYYMKVFQTYGECTELAIRGKAQICISIGRIEKESCEFPIKITVIPNN